MTLAWAYILALLAEVEGMKATNTAREHRGEAQAYDEDAFIAAAEQIRVLVILVRDL